MDDLVFICVPNNLIIIDIDVNQTSGIHLYYIIDKEDRDGC